MIENAAKIEHRLPENKKKLLQDSMEEVTLALNNLRKLNAGKVIRDPNSIDDSQYTRT